MDRFAVGYSGIGYATAGVRAVPLAEKDGGKCLRGGRRDDAYSRELPPRPVPLRLHQQGAREGPRSVDARVRQADHVQGRAGGRRQGRLLPDPGLDRQGRAGQDPVDGHQRRRDRRARAGGPAIAGPPAGRFPGADAAVGSAWIGGPPGWSSSAGSSSSPPSWPSSFVIVAEVYPLFREPTAPLVAILPARWPGGGAWRAGRQRGPRGRRVSRGRVRHRPGTALLQLLSSEGRPRPAAQCPSPVWRARRSRPSATRGKGRYVVGTSDGRVIPDRDRTSTSTFAGGERTADAER